MSHFEESFLQTKQRHRPETALTLLVPFAKVKDHVLAEQTASHNYLHCL
jgi:hypothetical protein